MKQIHDPSLLSYYLTTYKFDQIFGTPDLLFRLYEYEKGELINSTRDSINFLQFIVSGTFQIYAIREDGSYYPICVNNEFTVLGDLEFCGEPSLQFFVEAREKVISVELPLENYRAFLMNDTVFLRYLLRSISRKMTLFSLSVSSFSTLEDRLMYYLEQECPEHHFRGVEATATHLRCSRRQLQRVLKELVEKGIIEKVGKGEYKKALTIYK